MQPVSNEQLQSLVTRLHRDGQLRAWSLIMTFFGDAVVPRGGVISSRTIRELMQHFAIEPGTVRTALSRLCSDGWIVRQMQGRESFYQLADISVEPFEQASKLIYQSRVTTENAADWAIAVNHASWPKDLPPGVVRLNHQCLLFRQPDTNATELIKASPCMLIHGQLEPPPDWVEKIICPDAIAAEYNALYSGFEQLQGALMLSPADAMTMRCLLIHQWRRVLLRTHPVAAYIHPTDWPADRCRQLVANVYRQLLEPSSRWLDEHATGPDGPLLDGRDALGSRFHT